MRSLVRIAAPVIAAVAIALGGASSALAASRAPSHWSPPPASAPVHAPSTWIPGPAFDASPGWLVNDAWCSGDVAYMTCFEVTGRVQFLIGQGTSGIVINVQTDADHYEQGVLVASDTEISHERFAVNPNGTYTTNVVTHTRVSDGDATCSFQEVYRIVDMELVTSHEGGTCA